MQDHEQRAAYFDLLPKLKVDYTSEINRYWQPGQVAYLAGKHPSRWQFRGNTNNPSLQPYYAYRIDPYKNFQLTATLSQNLYSGGQLTNAYRSSFLATLGAAATLEIAKQDLALAVAKAYYRALLGSKLLKVADESITQLEAFKKRARAMFRVGEALKVDIASAEAQLARARRDRTKALTDLNVARSQLNLLLGLPQNACIVLDERLSFPYVERCIREVYEIAMTNRVEIRKANISIEQALTEIKIAQAALRPSVDLMIQGQRTNDDWNVIDPEGTNEWSIQGTMSWSLDFFRSREKVRKSQSSVAQLDSNKRYLVEMVLQQVSEAYLQVQRSRSDIEDTKKEVEFRNEQYNLVNKQYKEQLATYLNVMDAQTGLDRAKASHYASKVDFLSNLASLNRQMGVLP
jgi:outer membrane protein TolC